MAFGYETYKNYLDTLLKRLIEEFGPDNLLACALFGSVARGTARPESDLDLIILHKPVEFKPWDRLYKVERTLEQEEEYKQLQGQGLHPQPTAIFRTEQELVDDPLILLDVLDHGLILYDPSSRLTELLERLKKRLNELGSKRVVLENGTWYWDLKPDWKPGEEFEIKL